MQHSSAQHCTAQYVINSNVSRQQCQLQVKCTWVAMYNFTPFVFLLIWSPLASVHLFPSHLLPSFPSYLLLSPPIFNVQSLSFFSHLILSYLILSYLISFLHALTYWEHGYNCQYFFCAFIRLRTDESFAHHRVNGKFSHPPTLTNCNYKCGIGHSLTNNSTIDTSYICNRYLIVISLRTQYNEI